jgi:hypothetical protein
MMKTGREDASRVQAVGQRAWLLALDNHCTTCGKWSTGCYKPTIGIRYSVAFLSAVTMSITRGTIIPCHAGLLVG